MSNPIIAAEYLVHVLAVEEWNASRCQHGVPLEINCHNYPRFLEISDQVFFLVLGVVNSAGSQVPMVNILAVQRLIASEDRMHDVLLLDLRPGLAGSVAVFNDIGQTGFDWLVQKH